MKVVGHETVGNNSNGVNMKVTNLTVGFLDGVFVGEIFGSREF